MSENVNNAAEKYMQDEEAKSFEQKSKEAKDNILLFYHANEAFCNCCYEKYEQFVSTGYRYRKRPVEIEVSDFKKLLDETTVLVLTANPIEEAICVMWLYAKQNNQPLKSYVVNGFEYIYDLCKLKSLSGESISIIHINPGKTGAEYTRRVLDDTTYFIFEPDYIISVGICYGFNKEKLQIGDTFIANKITVSRINFRPDGIEPVKEDEDVPDKGFLKKLEREISFSHPINIFSADNSYHVLSLTGELISANSLMDNKKIKDIFVKHYCAVKPFPLGGEMEGAGLIYSLPVRRHICRNWLMIKSVCDWGEDKNELDPDPVKSKMIKDKIQAYAMSNSCTILDLIIESII